VAELAFISAFLASSRDGTASQAPSQRPAGKAVLACLVSWAAVVHTATPVAAQGVSGAAITGWIRTVDSVAIADAVVAVANGSNGERWQTTTDARGRYFVEYLSVGGPYRLEVRAIGHEPATRDSIFLTLGQRLVADVSLVPVVVRLAEIEVTADPWLDPGRTGPAQIVPESTIARLPVDERDYTELARLAPQVTRSPNGGLSFAGQHDRFNNIQIDGASNNDLFNPSFAENGVPGWFIGLNAFTPEAVKELQVLSAPFDVRYANFAGGLVNAVTKSGSNRFEGSMVGYLESTGLSGTDSTGSRGEEFNRKEFGLTLGGPIVRDRVALFLNANVRRQLFPQFVPAPGSDTTAGADSAGVGIRFATLTRFQSILRNLGVEPGTFSAAPFRAPTRNLFAKITAQLGLNSRLEASHNYGHGNGQDETGPRFPGFYGLSSSGSENPETIHATRLAWTVAFGRRFSNELLLARVENRRTCTPNADFPEVVVAADEGFILAGSAQLCLGLDYGHTIWELTDNFGLAAGNHRLTFGAHGELIHLVDDGIFVPNGSWEFESLDALEQGEPAYYRRELPGTAGTQVDFHVRQIGFYAQDQWSPSPRLTLTAGLRFDVPFLADPATTHPVVLRDLGINTALTPSGNILWSPRAGANYDLSGRGVTLLRGGVGLFAGRPAYQWFRNVYSTTGNLSAFFECFDDGVPAFTLDPANQPTACLGASPPFPVVNYFDPEFRFPRSLKIALGADHLLPGGVVGTVDFLFTRAVDAFQVFDANLIGPTGVAAGEGDRVLYGAIDPATGEATPDHRSSELFGVYEIRNGRSGDRSFSVSGQARKRFGGAELSVAYTYTDAEDRVSSDGDFASTNASSTPVNGTLEHRDLSTSFWERPHKVTVTGMFDLPLGLRLGLIYLGTSGPPFSYVVQGDANADGFSNFDVSNDVVYVPRESGDITLADPSNYPALDRIIEDEPCLRSQRGRLLRRNSCADPWVHETQVRLAKLFRVAGGRTLEVTADLFNALNFLDGDWGLVRQTLPVGFAFSPSGRAIPLLELVGYDEANGRGIYRLASLDRRRIDPDASRWRFQLGAKVSF
jgi:hypothetical protein